MKPLVLFLTIWGSDYAPDHGPMVYIMGSGMTAQACTDGMQALDRMATLVGGSVSCEIDQGHGFDDDEYLTSFPACEYEDSTNCFWNASEFGNGQGVSFYNVYGDVLPVDWTNESQ